MYTTTYILPTHLASALINDDFSGLNEEEKTKLKKWIDSNSVEGYRFNCINADIDNEYFASYHNFDSLACNVCEFTFDCSPSNPQP